MNTVFHIPDVPCSVCDNLYRPKDDCDFVCSDCQKKLIGHCGCGFGTIEMDWGVDLDSDLPYFWIIECVCGETLKSRLHGLNDINSVAKELHKEWLSRETIQNIPFTDLSPVSDAENADTFKAGGS